MPVNQEREKLIQGERKVEQTEAVLVDVVEERAGGKVPKEVESWLEEIERAPKQATITDDKQQKILKPAGGGQVKVVLPTTRKTFKSGLTKAVNDAGKWFSEFVFRLIKIKKGKVKFEDDT